MADVSSAGVGTDIQFPTALSSHFGDPFVVPLTAIGGLSFFALCARQGTGEDSAVSLTLTNCASGIFSRRLGESELTEMRQDSGMAEFGWNGFLRLLSNALRGVAGCSTVLEMRTQNDVVLGSSVARASEGAPNCEGTLNLLLTFRFKLEAAALMSQVQLEPRVIAPTSAGRYLQELHNFVSSAVVAASANNASIGGASDGPSLGADNSITMERSHKGVATTLHQSRTAFFGVGSAVTTSSTAVAAGVGQRVAIASGSDLTLGGGLQQSDAPMVRSQSAQATTSEVGKVPPMPVTAATPFGATLVGSSSAIGSTTVGSSAVRGPAAKAVSAVRAPAPKKRVGGLLDPGARRLARGGANPFQLSR